MFVRAVVVVLLLNFASLAPGADDPSRESIRAALQNAFNAMTPPEMVRGTIAGVDKQLDKGCDARVGIEATSTRSGKSMIAITSAGQLHQFELTPAQAITAGLTKGAISTSGSGTSMNAWPEGPFPLKLEKLQILSQGPLNAEVPIEASVVLRGNVPSDSGYSLRVVTNVGVTWLTSTSALGPVGADGVLKITAGKLDPKPDEIHFGPTVIMVDVLAPSSTRPGASRVVAASIATLVDLQPNADQYVRGSIKFLNDSAAVLASVKDEATGRKAIEDFKQLAARNRTVVNAMERLGPLPEDEESRLMKKYEREMVVATEKLSAETARLEQTPYGPAFLDQLQQAMQEKP